MPGNPPRHSQRIRIEIETLPRESEWTRVKCTSPHDLLALGNCNCIIINRLWDPTPPRWRKKRPKNSRLYKRATFFCEGQRFESATFCDFSRKVPKKVDWGHKKPCVSVRAWHEKMQKQAGPADPCGDHSLGSAHPRTLRCDIAQLAWAR